MAATGKTIIKVEGIHKSFLVGENQIEVLKGVDFEVHEGDFLVVIGPSGCGKSTMLHIMLGLEEPTSGKVIFDNFDLYAGTNEDDRSEFRKTHVGMVYQQANWIKSLTVKENVLFPLLLMDFDENEAGQKALEKLDLMKMKDWADYIPTELSGGQQQRVALSRALVNEPDVIIADEPTGNLDFEAGQNLMLLLQSLNCDHHKTVIMVTHDLEYLKYATRAVRFFDGKMVEEITDPTKFKEGEDFHSKRNSEIKGKTAEPLEEEKVINKELDPVAAEKTAAVSQPAAQTKPGEPSVRIEDL